MKKRQNTPNAPLQKQKSLHTSDTDKKRLQDFPQDSHFNTSLSDTPAFHHPQANFNPPDKLQTPLHPSKLRLEHFLDQTDHQPLQRRSINVERHLSDQVKIIKAIHDLEQTHPHLSAAKGLWVWQKIVLSLAIVTFFVASLSNTTSALAILGAGLSLFFVGIVILRFLACFTTGQKFLDGAQQTNTPEPATESLPIYTLLVPLYREAHMLPSIVTALSELNYPKSKLDAKLILESEDIKTQAAAAQINLPSFIEVVIVPNQGPRTKPKALNFALQSATGDYLVIYDAEDRPEPDQLLKAIAAFHNDGPDLGCIQAKLSFYNWRENWLTRQFTVEYAALFDGLLPALQRLRLPIPLGGTSNHFRMSALKQAGAWDPFNLTEDADLGIRLSRLGYRTKVLQSTTFEEANCRLTSWMKQRTRWLKGWMQTYFVHMRRPGHLLKGLGIWGFVGFQALIGGLIISALAHPIFYGLLAYDMYFGTALDRPASFHENPFWALAIFNLVLGYSSAIILGWIGLAMRKRTNIALHVIFMPVYWLLISVAAYRAIAQLITNPFLWEKTEHGVSRIKPPASSQDRHTQT